MSKRYPSVIRYQTHGLGKWSRGLFVCLHTSPLSWEQLAPYCTCGGTHAHTHTQLTKKHMFSLSYLVCTHTMSLCPTHTHTPHVYPITGAPRPSLEAEKPNLFIPMGIMGGGGDDWNASNRAQGPLSQSSLITAPPHPPHPNTTASRNSATMNLS